MNRGKLNFFHLLLLYDTTRIYVGMQNLILHVSDDLIALLILYMCKLINIKL